MSASLPSKGAIILVDTTEVGKVYGFEYSESAKPIVEHLLSGGDPDLVDVDELSYSFRWDAAYLDDTYGTKLRAGTSFTWRVRPVGTGSGLAEVQLTGAVITKRTVRAAKGTVIMENVEGVAKSIGNTAQSA